MKRTIIKPQNGWSFFKINELFEFSELFRNFLIRDIKLRYKQTIIGVLWIVLQPLTTVGMFTVFFGRIVNLPSDGVPYSVFVFAAMLPWFIFSQGVSRSATSIVGSSTVISKVFFPRIILPLSACFSALFDFLFALLFFALFIFFKKITVSFALLFFPVIIFIVILLTLGVGIFIAAASVYYRDFMHILPFMIQVLTFISPIGYSSSIIPLKYKFIYCLNPLVGIIEGVRWSIFGLKDFPALPMLFSALFSVLVFIISIFVFRKMERFFADVV